MDANKKQLPATHDDSLFRTVKRILDDARISISRTVNSTIIQAYWHVGKHIVEHEQKGEQRAEYGKDVINSLSARLVKEYGNGFTPANLRYMRQLFLCFPICHALRDKLTWTHYRTLLKVQNEAAREFYITECVRENWSTRQLERQINTLFYERLISSSDKDVVKGEIQSSSPPTLEPREIIRDPYILEFLGIPQGEHFLENDLELMLLSKLQHFLLEMGKGFSFVARQKRISFDDEHFFVDMVFYNYLARCFVLIDLKTDKLTHQDLGQMQMYVNYYTREMMNPGDNPPVGIVLCADKSEAVVEYTLPEGNEQIFAAKYLTYMPTEEELKYLIESNRLR
ncbi:MAG: PDDEXK nuclease domain-containing protein [Thermoguttaceae bacterium]